MAIIKQMTLVSLMALTGFVAVAQSVPANFNLQGRLNTNGSPPTPVNGVVDMTFSIWDMPSSGTKLWQEPATGTVPVAVANGIFNYRLGSTVGIPTSLFVGTGDHYVEITVNTEVLTPRQPLSSVPSSYQSQNAHLATNSNGLGGFPAISWQKLINPSSCPAGQYLTGIDAMGAITCATPPGVTLGGVLELNGYVDVGTGSDVGPAICPVGWQGTGGKMYYKVVRDTSGESTIRYFQNFRLVCYRSDVNVQVIYLTGYQDQFFGSTVNPPSCPSGWVDTGINARYQGGFYQPQMNTFLLIRACYRVVP